MSETRVSERGEETGSRRIGFLITDFRVGGAQRQLTDVALRLAARGWRVAVVSMVPPTAPALVGELTGAGIPVRDLGMRLGVPDPRGAGRLVALLRSGRPHVLHTHLVHATLLARGVRPVAPVGALVSTIHGIGEASRWREWGYRLTRRASDLTTHVSRVGAEHYAPLGVSRDGRVEVVPNGVDPSRFHHRAAEPRPGPFVWLSVGRLEPSKDYEGLLAAFRRLVEDGVDAVLQVAGEGPARSRLEGLVRREGLNGRVQLLGVRGDIPDLMASADAYVTASRAEGLPMALLEAGASGLPIVATGVGGTRDVVVEGENGFLVPPGDAGALAASMRRLQDLGRDDRRRMGAAGRRRVELHFDLDRIVDRWEAIYRGLLRSA